MLPRSKIGSTNANESFAKIVNYQEYFSFCFGVIIAAGKSSKQKKKSSIRKKRKSVSIDIFVASVLSFVFLREWRWQRGVGGQI